MLAYCITEPRAGIELPTIGVAGAPIRTLSVAALLCFVSDFHSPLDRDSLPEFAKSFHHVLQRIFAQTAIIPFRFPTVIASEKELMQFIEGRSEDYRAALSRLRDKVQMDIRILLQPSDRAQSTSGPAEQARISGKQYLQGKRELHHGVESGFSALRHAAEPLVDEWIQRDTPEGQRAFVLLDRSSLPVFLEKIRAVRTPTGALARVTGPWPPSEFVKIGDHELPENEHLR